MKIKILCTILTATIMVGASETMFQCKEKGYYISDRATNYKLHPGGGLYAEGLAVKCIKYVPKNPTQ